MRLLGLQVACSGSRESVGAPVVDAQGACVGAVFQRGTTGDVRPVAKCMGAANSWPGLVIYIDCSLEGSQLCVVCLRPW